MIQPMLASLTERPFDSDRFIAEWKYNGVRVIGHRRGGSVRLLGRSGSDYTRQFPEVVEVLAGALSSDAVVDGEIVCLGEDGLPEFNRIQNRIGKRDPDIIKAMRERFPAQYMLFDVVEVMGQGSLADIVARLEKARQA